MAYNNFHIDQQISLFNRYLKMKPDPFIYNENMKCNEKILTDSFLLDAYVSLKNSIDKKSVPDFGISFSLKNVKKITKKCCDCPNEDGINYSAKNKIRKAMYKLVSDWNKLIHHFKNDKSSEERLKKEYLNPNKKIGKKRRG